MPCRRYNHGFLQTGLRMILRADDEPLVIRSFFVCNTGGSNASWDLQHVPADEDESTEHCLFYQSIIRAKITETHTEPIFLLPGDEIHALSSVANVTTITFYLQTYTDFVRSI